MTVSQQIPVANCWGNNSATEFPFNFFIEKESELLVEHTNLSGVKSTLENGVDYSIHEVGNKEGSYITFPLAGSRYNTLAWDTSTDKKELLTISLTLPIEQSAEYEDSGDLSKKNLELSFDYAIRLIQILNRTISRAVKVKEGDESTPDQLIESLNDSKRVTIEAANLATSKAEESLNNANLAKDKADIATAKTAEVTETYNNAMADIQKDWQDAIEEIEEKQTTAETSIANLQTTAESTVTNGIAEIESTKNTAISDVSNAGAEQVSNIKKTGFYMQDDKLYYINADGETKEFISGGGRELLEIYIDPFCDESENKGRIANGQIIIQSQFKDVTKKLKKRVGWDSENQKATLNTSLVCTEEEWQAIKTASKLGQCGKFVIDDEAGTIRLPAIININGLTDLSNAGLIKDESLPNIKNTNSITTVANVVNTGEALYVGAKTNDVNYSGTGQYNVEINFNASRSSSTYKDNAPVQQEAVQYPYVICVNTGVEEAERPINNYQVNNTNSYGDNKYVGNTTLNNSSWLKSAGQKNSGTIYTGFYNWAVANIGQPFGAGLIKESSATDITDYDLVIDQTEQTFILPTLNGSEDLPSDKYDNLTLGASGTQYTAPANGFVLFRRRATSSNTVTNAYVAFDKGESYSREVRAAQANWTANTTGDMMFVEPVKKDDVYTVRYRDFSAVDTAVSVFKFYYFQGNGNLYYYVGDTLQNTDLINIARLGEQLSNKVDSDFANVNTAGKEYIAHQAMPSDKFIDLTLNASGSTYTAPADGWVSFCKSSGAAGNWVVLRNSTTSSVGNLYANGGTAMNATVKVKKGDTFYISYSLNNTSNVYFCFIYAVGSEPTA